MPCLDTTVLHSVHLWDGSRCHWSWWADWKVIWTMKIDINRPNTYHGTSNRFKCLISDNYKVLGIEKPKGWTFPIQNVNPKHFKASRQTHAWFQGNRCAIWDDLRHDGRSASIGWVCHALRPVPYQKKLDSAVHAFLLDFLLTGTS